jgi:branched-subunit amino acid ABC-type transport system permease component
MIVFSLSSGALIAFSALGITLIFGTVHILNLAYGDVFALSSVLAAIIQQTQETKKSKNFSSLLGVQNIK